MTKNKINVKRQKMNQILILLIYHIFQSTFTIAFKLIPQLIKHIMLNLWCKKMEGEGGWVRFVSSLGRRKF